MRNRKWMFVLILIVLLAACGKATPTVTPKPAATFDARPYVGRYEGTWTNQTVGTTGAVTVEIKTDNNRRTATVALTFTGPYLGLSGPLAATATGGWDAKQATITGKSTITGDVAVTVDPNQLRMAIHDWYITFDYIEWSKKYPVIIKPVHVSTLNKFRKWFIDNQIKGTPTTYFNSNLISGTINIADLIYMFN